MNVMVEKNVTLLPIRYLKSRESAPCTFYPGLFVYDSTGETINMFTTKQNYVYVTDSEECTGYEIIIVAINRNEKMKFTCIGSTRITDLDTVNDIVESIINDLLYGNHSTNMLYLSKVHYRVLHFSKIEENEIENEHEVETPIKFGNEHLISSPTFNKEDNENECGIIKNDELGHSRSKKHVILQIPELETKSIITNEKSFSDEKQGMSEKESPKFKPLIQRNSIGTPDDFKELLEILEPLIDDSDTLEPEINNDSKLSRINESKSANDLLSDNTNYGNYINELNNTMVIMNACDCMRSKSSIDQLLQHSKL